MNHLYFQNLRREKQKGESLSQRIERLRRSSIKLQKDTKSDLVSTTVSVRRLQRKQGKNPTIGGSLSVGGKLNPWIQHVKAHKKKHPHLSHKQALQDAKRTYKKKSTGHGGKKKKGGMLALPKFRD